MTAPEQPPGTPSETPPERSKEQRRKLIEDVAQKLGHTFENVTPDDMFVSDMLHAVAVFALGATTSLGCTSVELLTLLQAIQLQIVDDDATPPPEPRGN